MMRILLAVGVKYPEGRGRYVPTLQELPIAGAATYEVLGGS
jgi:hypothetical protein